jgi:hypothetical protein
MSKYQNHSSTVYDTKVKVTCTDNGKTVETEVTDFVPEKILTVYIATNKIIMHYNARHKNYVGSMFNMEFTSAGPQTLGSYR